MSDIIISFVVPIYKVGEFLPKCLDSLMAQPIPEAEFILVDDGSPDNSGSICDEYVKKDTRFRVYHNKNLGVSAARNFGLAKSVGKWVCFVDGDDALHEKFVEKTKDLYDSDYDIIYFLMHMFFDDAHIPLILSPLRKVELSDKIRLLQKKCMYGAAPDVNLEPFPICGIGAKLYRREFLVENELTLPDKLIRAQDLVFNVKALGRCKKALLLTQELYLYRQNYNSITHAYNEKIVDAVLKQLKLCDEALTEYYPGDKEIRNYYYCRCISELTVCLQLFLSNPKNHREYEQRRHVFCDLASLPVYKDATKNCNPALLSADDRVLFEAIRTVDFNKATEHVAKKLKAFRKEQLILKWKLKLGLYKLKKREE